MTDTKLRALGVVRRDVAGRGVDVHELAARHGFRVASMVVLDTGPALSALIICQQIRERGIAAVIVPGFEHIEAVRWLVTELTSLITPMRVYPQGYQWPVCEWEGEFRA